MSRFCAACLGRHAAVSWRATTASPLNTPSPAVFATALPRPLPSAPTPTPSYFSSSICAPPTREQVLLHARPTTLTLAGDSAGANLALATSFLLLHPHYTSLHSPHFRAHSTHAAQSFETSLLTDAAACSLAASPCLHTAPHASPRMQALADAAPCGSTTALASLLLLYPCIDPSRSGGSHAQHAASPTLAAAELAWFWKHYVPGDPPLTRLLPTRVAFA